MRALKRDLISYTMFPEVSRIPLIVRVPERFRETFVVDDIAQAYRFAAEP
jgi:hypothetical protein